MIPFIKEPEIEVEIDSFNPNLYVTMSDYTANRLWANNTYPWIFGDQTQRTIYNIINYNSPWIVP